jgi:DNA-binding transcriptional regulator YiaG
VSLSDQPAMKPFRDQNHYEILEVSPDALPLEIRRAYQLAFALYQDESIATYSFFSEEERRAILARIERAYLTLINPETRKAYEQDLVAGGWLKAESCYRENVKGPIPIYNLQKARTDGPAPAKRSELKSRTENNPVIQELLTRDTLAGADLQTIREALQVTLEEIAERTNIRIDTLRAIEQESLDRLPPLVYLKGFLRAYSRCLELDERIIPEAYLRKIGWH